jgi:hypothetical protein
VRRTASLSPVGTSTPIVTSASRHLRVQFETQQLNGLTGYNYLASSSARQMSPVRQGTCRRNAIFILSAFDN